MEAGFREGMGWPKPDGYFAHVLRGHATGQLVVLVSEDDDAYLGHVLVAWTSPYGAFRASAIPEIRDLNVVAAARRQGVGSELMSEAERLIAERSPTAGIGVGLDADYGAAQRLYVRRGYVPDGAGALSHHAPLRPGEPVVVDDDLVLYLTKDLVRPARTMPGP